MTLGEGTAVASTAVRFPLRPNDGFWSGRRVVEIRGTIMERETAWRAVSVRLR